MIALRVLPLALLLAAPAAAQGDPQPVQVGNWRVKQYTYESCHAAAVFDHLLVSFSEDSTGQGDLAVSDDRWQLEEGATMAGTISWDGWANARPIDFSVMKTGAGRSVLLAYTSSWFTENLAESKRFWLKIPEAQFEGDFAIDDKIAVLTAIATCNQQL